MLAIAGTEAIGYIGYAALVASGFFSLYTSRAKQANKDLATSVTALQGRLAADQDEIRSLQDRTKEQALALAHAEQQTADLRASLRTLERVVTSKDQITDLTAVVQAGFAAQGVHSDILQLPMRKAL